MEQRAMERFSCMRQCDLTGLIVLGLCLTFDMRSVLSTGAQPRAMASMSSFVRQYSRKGPDQGQDICTVHRRRSRISSRGMRPSEPPSPDRQSMLYPSHSQNMERPVRSFKSFIRVTPQTPEKPLPTVLVKPPLQRFPSSSSIITVQTRSTGLSLWEPPSDWDKGEGNSAQTTPPSAVRQYSPLIPEPPEDIAAMQADPVLWKQNNGSFEQTTLEPICERTAPTPEIPPRNPSRLSLSLSSPITTRKNSKDTLPSLSSRYSTNTSNEELSGKRFESDALPSPLDLVSALSYMAMKDGEIDSPGLRSPRDQGIVYGGPRQRSDSLQFEDESRLDLQGNKLTIFRKGSVLADNSPTGLEALHMSDRMQALGFAQDYHNFLTDQTLYDYDEFAPPLPPKEQDLTPRPLAWNKPAGSPPLGQHRIRKMSSWVNHRMRRDSQTGGDRRTISDPELHSRTRLREEFGRDLKHDARLASIVQHGKDLLSRRIWRKGSESGKPMVISLSRGQRFESAPEPPPASTAPFEIATPVLRLPGGLAIVRQSPLSTSKPQPAGGMPPSPFSDLSWPDFTVSSPFRCDFSRRSSYHSGTSQTSNNPFAAIKQKFSSPSGQPSGSPLILRSFSYSTTSLATHAAHEFTSPYSTPQPRRRSHNVGSPLTLPPSYCSYRTEQPARGMGEDSNGKLNMFERAKIARDAWKKHQKDIKNERLKQSIRLVGPADATDVAGYIKFGIDGSQSVDSGIGEDEMLYQTVKRIS